MDREQFAEWASNPTTIEIKKHLQKQRDALSDNLSCGSTLGADPGETALLTARVVGTIEGLDEFLNLDYPEDAQLTEGE